MPPKRRVRVVCASQAGRQATALLRVPVSLNVSCKDSVITSVSAVARPEPSSTRASTQQQRARVGRVTGGTCGFPA